MLPRCSQAGRGWRRVRWRWWWWWVFRAGARPERSLGAVVRVAGSVRTERTGDEAGDRWQRQHRAALSLVPKPHCLSLFNSGLALAALRFVPRLWRGPPPPPPGRVVPCAMHTATAAEARVSHVSRLCLRCAVLSGPGVKRLDGEVAPLPFAHTCHINARGSTRYTAWLLAGEEVYHKLSDSPSMRGCK
jgi:hypothetical protein